MNTHVTSTNHNKHKTPSKHIFHNKLWNRSFKYLFLSAVKHISTYKNTSKALYKYTKIENIKWKNLEYQQTPMQRTAKQNITCKLKQVNSHAHNIKSLKNKISNPPEQSKSIHLTEASKKTQREQEFQQQAQKSKIITSIENHKTLITINQKNSKAKNFKKQEKQESDKN